MSLETQYFSNTIANDLFRLLVGDRLGEGIDREVFEMATDPDGHVLKFETGAGRFQNVAEWQVWDHVQHTPLARWFAPITHISPCGTVLIQRRTRAGRPDEMPERIPSFFTDVKLDNWGMLDGQPVCHDYGHHLLLERGMTKRMRKVVWT